MLELWGLLSNPLSSLTGSKWPGVVAPDRVLSMGQTELFEIELFICIKMDLTLNYLYG